MTAFRLATGGRIDRLRPLSFTFDGASYQGYEGDTLASALLANDVSLVGRSFKFHRRRGIMTAGAEEPNALVQLEAGPYSQPNLRATQIELYDNLAARSLNAWPCLRCDIGAMNGLLSPLLIAGFYYKTFMWPRSFWLKVYEPLIRRMAGLGTAPTGSDPDVYDKIHTHADVLVIGAGPAGLSAALAASRSGARVMLVDEQAELGGSLLQTRQSINDRPAVEWAASTVAEISSYPDVSILPRTTAFGYYDQNYLMLLERCTDHLGPGARPGLPRQRLWHIRAKQVVLATGAHERPLVFRNNDRPGVMLASAVSCYVARYGVAAGRQAVICTNNDSAYWTVLDLAGTGVAVKAVVDLRRAPHGNLVSAVRRLGIEVIAGSAVTHAAGRTRLSAIDVTSLGNGGRPARRIGCDVLAMSGGWDPVVHLFSQSQGKLGWNDKELCRVPGHAAQPQSVVGAANGTFSMNGCLAEGAAAGAKAAAAAGFVVTKSDALLVIEDIAGAPPQAMPVAAMRAHRRGKAFVDFQNDVTAADIWLAASEGLTSVEHVKRYTTNGMGTDQGKTSNVNAIRILAEITGRSVAETGTTTFRPPYTPVAYGALAGRDTGNRSDAVRLTPMHDLHVSAGAVFEDVGQWKRPWFYPRGGEDMHATVQREAKAVRASLGIQDISTLGKIEIRGADAAEFLDRIYTNSFSTLGVRRCRYGIMCRDDGMVFDDGVTTRLAEDHFFMTTTTGGAAHVHDWLEELLQTDWPHLKVYLTSVTDHWAAMALAGPRARDAMRDLAPTSDWDANAFPYLSMRRATVAGFEAHVFRISFSGELAYEIHVAAHHGYAAWEAVMDAGGKYDITPYGTETMHLLRAEKGYIIVGQETDGTVTPLDLGFDRMISKHKPFIGRRSLSRLDTARTGRKQLVGLLPEDSRWVLPEGAAIVASGKSTAAPAIGHVTSSYWSPTIGRSFALALVQDGRTQLGAVVDVPVDGSVAAATIVEPVFWDKQGTRLHG